MPGALAVARPRAGHINGCAKPGGGGGGGGGGAVYPNCSADDYPLFAYIDAPLYASRAAAGNWTCFNSRNAVFACVGLSGGARLTEAPVPCTGGTGGGGGGASWNGTLLLFNGSKTSRSFGVLQVAAAADYNHSFGAFVRRMATAAQSIETTTTGHGADDDDDDDDDGALRYTSLGGDALLLGEGGAQIPPYAPLARSYDSPFMSAPHAQQMAVTISAPGFANLTLAFDASSS